MPLKCLAVKDYQYNTKEPHVNGDRNQDPEDVST